MVDSLQGLCTLNPQLGLDKENKGTHFDFFSAHYSLTGLVVVYVANPDRSKVALICGGGSGHEPSHAGFVGASRRACLVEY